VQRLHTYFFSSFYGSNFAGNKKNNARIAWFAGRKKTKIEITPTGELQIDV
jgi:hypothetical protein